MCHLLRRSIEASSLYGEYQKNTRHIWFTLKQSISCPFWLIMAIFRKVGTWIKLTKQDFLEVNYEEAICTYIHTYIAILLQTIVTFEEILQIILQTIHRLHYQWKLSVNIWAGSFDCSVMGPCLLPVRLDGHMYKIYNILHETCLKIPSHCAQIILYSSSFSWSAIY